MSIQRWAPSPVIDWSDFTPISRVISPQLPMKTCHLSVFMIYTNPNNAQKNGKSLKFTIHFAVFDPPQNGYPP